MSRSGGCCNIHRLRSFQRRWWNFWCPTTMIHGACGKALGHCRRRLDLQRHQRLPSCSPLPSRSLRRCRLQLSRLRCLRLDTLHPRALRFLAACGGGRAHVARQPLWMACHTQLVHRLLAPLSVQGKMEMEMKKRKRKRKRMCPSRYPLALVGVPPLCPQHHGRSPCRLRRLRPCSRSSIPFRHSRRWCRWWCRLPRHHHPRWCWRRGPSGACGLQGQGRTRGVASTLPPGAMWIQVDTGGRPLVCSRSCMLY